MSKKLIGAAAVITDGEGRILLVRHSYGKLNWELPGGLSEAEESAAQTAEREVLEETGLTVAAGRLTGVYYDPDYDMHHFVFICKEAQAGVAQPDLTEILECSYFRPDELPKPISDFTVQRINHALQEWHGSGSFHLIGPRQWIE